MGIVKLEPSVPSAVRQYACPQVVPVMLRPFALKPAHVPIVLNPNSWNGHPVIWYLFGM